VTGKRNTKPAMCGLYRFWCSIISVLNASIRCEFVSQASRIQHLNFISLAVLSS